MNEFYFRKSNSGKEEVCNSYKELYKKIKDDELYDVNDYQGIRGRTARGLIKHALGDSERILVIERGKY